MKKSIQSCINSCKKANISWKWTSNNHSRYFSVYTNANIKQENISSIDMISTDNQPNINHSNDDKASSVTNEHRHDDVKHAVISVFELFSIGVGPSSSHTVGPMRAAKKFVDSLNREGKLDNVSSLICELYGSLACTGIGHATDFAVLMGLEGFTPEGIDPTWIPTRVKEISKSNQLKLLNENNIEFQPLRHIKWFMNDVLPYHSNGLKFIAYDSSNNIIKEMEYYSVGGGFVVTGNPNNQNAFRMIDSEANITELNDYDVKYKFKNGKELENLCWAMDMNISDIIFENELKWRNAELIKEGLLNIWNVMDACIENGLSTKGLLNATTRRAKKLAEKIIEMEYSDNNTGLNSINMKGNFSDDWLRCWAVAVNEENAGGNRVVTAPTNGAAGVIPAVIKYYKTYHKTPNDDGICKMLLTAGAMGMLYKRGASLSAAEVGCQGEIGVASSMASAALCEVMGGNVFQVTNAAEIAMEHSLGLTCDPVGGYVEIPCIERNAIGASKAVASARMALMGDGKNVVSLDNVIETMRQTGWDMQAKYKETSKGGLAQNVPSC